MLLTFKGQTIQEEDGIKLYSSIAFKDQIYKKGILTDLNSGDAFEIDGEWFTLESGMIYYDYNLKTYRKKSEVEMLIYGVVEFKDKKYTFGYFEKNLKENTQVLNSESESFPCISYKILKDHIFLGLYNGSYVFKEFFSDSYIRDKKMMTPTYDNFNTKLYNYGDDESSQLLVDYYNKTDASALEEIAKEIPFSFGLEYETNRGGIPEHSCFEHSLLPVRDGSIQGREFVTVPMSGSKGLAYILKQCKLLSKYTTVNEQCSLHIHFGTLDMDMKQIIACYILSQRIQEEMLDILPPYKKSSDYFKTKKEAKDHCQHLPLLGLNRIDMSKKAGQTKAFNTILDFLNEGNRPEEIGNLSYRHNREGSEKWNWVTRYYQLNFIPLLFDKKKTIEFRYHPGTTNKFKVINWLLICNGIIRFAKENTDLILNYKEKIMLTDIMSVYPEKLQKYISEYIIYRNNIMCKLRLSQNIYGTEFSGDTKFKYKEWEIPEQKDTALKDG